MKRKKQKRQKNKERYTWDLNYRKIKGNCVWNNKKKKRKKRSTSDYIKTTPLKFELLQKVQQTKSLSLFFFFNCGTIIIKRITKKKYIGIYTYLCTIFFI